MRKRSVQTGVLLLAAALLTRCDSPQGSPPDEDAGAVPPADAGPRDAGLTDAGPVDSGRDASVIEDAGPSDSGADAGPVDSGSDAGPADAGVDAGAADAGNPGCVRGTFQAYRGNLHSHTSLSDGAGLPSDAYQHARDVAHIDFLAVTDHAEQFMQVSALWDECHSMADAANATGSFVALCGFEYGTAMVFNLPLPTSAGHINVLFSEGILPALQPDLRDFYTSLKACPTCLSQFNHPGSSETGTFLDFEYDAAVDAKMGLFEFNGAGPVWDLFFQALGAGWHVGPSCDQDNHDPDWGDKDDHRTGLYMADLSRESLRDAYVAGRSFMSYDKNASIRMMAEGECWMGSTLTGRSSLSLRVEASDPDAGDGFSVIELFGPGQTLIASHDCAGATDCSADFTVPVTAATFAVARAIQADGNWLVAAPVWASP